jgi:CRP/FNR family cyclic AMP-dependent transcriptional regulator
MMHEGTAYLFQGIREETRQKILAAAREESHAPGNFLFRQGDAARHFYILREGRIRLSVGPHGLLAYVISAPGDIIGWSSLVENEAYTASAECLVPVKVLKIDQNQLDQILHQDPASGMAFFQRLAALIGRRLVKSYQATLSVHGEREPRPGG